MRRFLAWVAAISLFAALGTGAQAYAPDDVVGEVADLLRGTNDPGAEISGQPLGYAAADALREQAGADIAIVNGADIAHNLQGGEVTWADVQAVFTEEREAGLARVTPAQLKAMLETAVSNLVTGDDDCLILDRSRHPGFVQPSGFSYEADGSAAPGDRILSIKLSDGTKLDLTDNVTVCTLAASTYMLSGGYDMPAVSYAPLGFTLAEALADAIAGTTLPVPDDERVRIVGTGDLRIIDMFPIGLVILAAVLIGMFNFKKNTRYDYTRYNYRNEEGYERKKYIKN
mgnify:FL=1